MAEEQMSLEGILGDEKPVSPAAEKPALEIPVLGENLTPKEVKDPVEKQQAERNISRKQAMRDKEQDAQGRVRDPDTGQYVAKTPPEEKPAAPAAATPPKEPEAAKPAVPAAPQQEFTEKEKAFLRAAQEERGKRQALEARLAAMEAAKPQEPAKTFWDDPEAALKAHEDRIRQESTNARLGMAEYAARQRHPDFQEKVAIFTDLAMKTPGLGQAMLSSPDPAEFVYTTAKNHKDLQDAGGIEQMRAKIERETTARVRAEVETELKAKADELAKARAALPTSLSDARSTGPANRPVWSGPTPLDSILGK